MDKMRMESPDFTQVNINKLAHLFPNVITETKGEDGKLRKAVNFDLLRQLLSKDLVEGDETYEFTWVGKKEAILEAGRSIRKTLRPCKEESKNWDTTENLYIEGDNLDVLKLLQESYLGKIKMIYIDPPYNTGNDFVYKDNFIASKEDYDDASGAYDDEGDKLFKNTESNGRFHSDWCSMIYPRIQMARNLLTDDGVILVSIGDRELKNILAILDEIFGAKNQVCCFVWKSRAKPTNAGNAKFKPQKVSEYILVYSKCNNDSHLYNVVSSKEHTYPHEDENGKFRTTTILTSNRGTFRRETMRFESHGYTPNEDFRWKAGKEIIDNLYETNHIYITDDGTPMEKKYSHEESDPLYPIYTYIDSDLSGTSENGKSELNNLIGSHHGFDTVKPVQLIKYLIQTFTNKNDIIFDFFAGSSTTAHAVIEQNSEDNGRRRFFLAQIEEKCKDDGEALVAGFKTIIDIGKKRIDVIGEKVRKNSAIDIGFRVLKVADTNMKDVYYGAEDIKQDDLLNYVSNIKEDRTELDLLFQCILDWHLPLTLKHTTDEIDGVIVHTYAYPASDEHDRPELMACFNPNMSENVVRQIAKKQPVGVVFRDASFASSPAKINVSEIFKTLSPDTTIRVL